MEFWVFMGILIPSLILNTVVLYKWLTGEKRKVNAEAGKVETESGLLNDRGRLEIDAQQAENAREYISLFGETVKQLRIANQDRVALDSLLFEANKQLEEFQDNSKTLIVEVESLIRRLKQVNVVDDILELQMQRIRAISEAIKHSEEKQ